MPEIKLEDYKVTYLDDEHTKECVFNKLIEWYTIHEAFDGETIMQCDAPYSDAPNILSELADNYIHFETEWY